jgi:diacylglycerol kinase
MKINNKIGPKDVMNFKRFFKSFKYCYEGMKYSFYHEQNIMVMIVIAIIVLIMGLVFPISYVERLVILLLIAMVLSLEMINTAIETAIDLVTLKENKLAKVAKDSASAAVGIMSMFSLIIGLLIFIPRIIELF